MGDVLLWGVRRTEVGKIGDGETRPIMLSKAGRGRMGEICPPG